MKILWEKEKMMIDKVVELRLFRDLTIKFYFPASSVLEVKSETPWSVRTSSSGSFFPGIMAVIPPGFILL